MNKRSTYNTFFRGFWVEVSDRLQDYVKKGRRNPPWLIMSIAGRFGWLRYCAKLMIRLNNRLQLNHQLNYVNHDDRPASHQSCPATQLTNEENDHVENVCTGLEPTKIVTVLNQDGIYTGLSLSQSMQQELWQFAHTHPCYGNLEPDQGFYYADKAKAEQRSGRLFFSAQYFNTSRLCSAIRRLGNDRQLVSIAQSYLGAKPIFTGSRLWWNFAIDDHTVYDPNYAITFFHYDLDDYACLRFFFYLTAVDEQAGPHVCVRGSHVNKKLAYLLSPVKRRSDDYVQQHYGTENLVSVCGAAGFGFAEDTFCIHKATRPLRGDRLMLQIQFALHDYGMHNDFKDDSRLRNIDCSGFAINN
ncbi:hypothetical protein Pse7367_3947 (plasmid) [Thalassoporum mexicanum PCC 7367]|uniref:hypothetical protein n=1 Tax=Thalassoporum mexicanum TaxID=3457544 RepID=UPI00029FD2BC|nr:hypothetical protein [Pseudanabaena sp. PCC 7367]AFY72162.1 hypothetical protein Pse7367_3947 [Pseudanabaena sp. PCC 7367]